MIFRSPSWVPQIDKGIPDTVLVGDFVTQRNHNLYDWSDDKATLICAISNKTYDMKTIKQRISRLSRSLSKELDWSSNAGSPWNKVIGIFSYNTIDFLITCWAVHQLGGICLLLHSTSTEQEIESHLDIANCNLIVTCSALLPVYQKVAAKRPLRAFLLDLPSTLEQPQDATPKYKTIEKLIEESSRYDELEPIILEPGESKSRVAYLCPTSGTSGKQKLAKITHYNVISNILQSATFESFYKRGRTEVVVGILPLSHSYGLILGHLMAWRGDCTILHPRFDMQNMLASISRYKIERLYLVPSIISALIHNSFLFEIYDVSTVRSVVTGSASFGPRMAEAVKQCRPDWQVLPGYGLTESGVIVSFTSAHDINLGSDGSLIPLVEGRLVREDGSDTESPEESGELLLRSPSIMLGYLGDEESNQKTFDRDGWLRTGDVAIFKKDSQGIEHLFIVDRKKDIMKVKGLQVAPVEIEAQLLAHEAVDEAAVISVPDEDSGERPYAFIVRSPKNMSELNEKSLKVDINRLVEMTLSEPHWLRSNICFLPEIPKSHNGKALKFKLKELIA